MAIVFHCEHCNKKIEAPDKVGGKHGKCPSCQNRITIPAPQEEEEELHLAPIDAEEEARRQQMMRETFSLTEKLLEEKSAPEVPTEEILPPAGGIEILPLLGLDEESLVKNIIDYLALMGEGELDQAEPLAETIINHGRRAKGILEQIALNQITDPKLAAFPHQVLMGMIRSLRTQINSNGAAPPL